jgi:AcrR family transcriptional regulator
MDAVPAPERTTISQIIAAGRAIVDDGGLDALNMQAVARRVGVRAPSLYKRLRDRDELIRRVVESTVDDLGVRLRRAVSRMGNDDPADALVALVRELRVFAHERPHSYPLIFGSLPPGARPERSVLAQASEPVFDATRRLVGDEYALDAARTVTAWANGFLSMELSRSFQLGGDVDRAFEWGIARIVESIARPS